MYFLISAPGGNGWMLILFVIALIVYISITCYRVGIKKGMRKGERLQPQKKGAFKIWSMFGLD